MGTTIQPLGLFPFWFGGHASLATVQPRVGTVCGSQPDGGANVAGGDRAYRHAPEPGQCRFHGLVRPAWPGLYRSRAGLSGAGSAFARRGDHPARIDRDGAAQHLRPRPQRDSWHKALRTQYRIARCRPAGRGSISANLIAVARRLIVPEGLLRVAWHEVPGMA